MVVSYQRRVAVMRRLLTSSSPLACGSLSNWNVHFRETEVQRSAYHVVCAFGGGRVPDQMDCYELSLLPFFACPSSAGRTAQGLRGNSCCEGKGQAPGRVDTPGTVG